MGEAKVLVNCHVFDGRSPDVRRDQYVLVRDGKIAGIGPAAAAGAAEDAAVVDLHGSYLMAGLFNMHTHFGLALPGPLGDSIQAMPLHELAFYVAGCARETLLSGVTTVRCVGESKGTDFALRSAIEAGHSRRDRVFSRPGGHWCALAGMGMSRQSHSNATGPTGLCAVRGRRSALAPISSRS